LVEQVGLVVEVVVATLRVTGETAIRDHKSAVQVEQEH
jgi:hypothetical protein